MGCQNCSRTILLVASFTALVTGSIALHAQGQSAREIERVVTEFLTAFSNRDFTRFVPFFSEDATMFFPPSAAAPTGLVRGRNEIEHTFRLIFAKSPPRTPGPVTPIRPLDLLVEEFGETAVVTFHLGSDAARQRRTIVMQRAGEQWRIVHLHGSASTSP